MHGVVTPAPGSASPEKPSDRYKFTEVPSAAAPRQLAFRAVLAPKGNYVSPDQFRADVSSAPNQILPGDFTILDGKLGIGEFTYVRPSTGTSATTRAGRPSMDMTMKGPEPKRPTRRAPPEMEFP
jgi:hypothetical protein